MSRLIGITIHQPFAYAIALGDELLIGALIAKLTENRGWAPPEKYIGADLAIHASKADFDEEEAEEVGHMLFDNLPDERKVLFEWVFTQGQWFAKLRAGMGKILCVAKLAGVASTRAELDAEQRRWWKGPVGWKLEHVRSLPRPVPCRGKQCLWVVPEYELGQVRQQVPE